MKFVIVGVYQNYIEAHLAKGMLEEQDITCWLKDENTVTIDPILTNAVGGIKLMVPEVQQPRALKIISDAKEHYNDLHPCPGCGSANIEYVSTPRKASNWVGTFASAILGVGSATPIDKVYHCFDCGHEYHE